MDKIVYVVTSGSYSDYGIVAMFSTEDAAKMFMERHPKSGFGGYNDIEQYTLDDNVEKMREGFSQYWVQMHDDGSTLQPPETNTWSYGETDCKFMLHAHSGKRFFNWFGWAKDPTHALKIANEVRIQLLASQPIKGKSS